MTLLGLAGNLFARCDINLAPLRYERVLRKDGGPIDHIDRAEHHVREGIVFNVNAFLDASLRPIPRRKNQQFLSGADGGGTHPHRLIAQFMAISEAIERWAFWDRVGSNMRDLFGFDIDSSTMGMAAFPGITQARAQRSATQEAVERFALLNWWEGRLHHHMRSYPDAGIEVVQISVPGTDIVPVIVFEDDPTTGSRYYGYGAGDCIDDAVVRARRELIRHRMVVNRYHERFPDPFLGLAAIEDINEKRALYFSMVEGRTLFDERCATGPWSREATPKKVFDGWVPGPWNRYAVVWRCLFEPPSEEYRSTRVDYFLW